MGLTVLVWTCDTADVRSRECSALFMVKALIKVMAPILGNKFTSVFLGMAGK